MKRDVSPCRLLQHQVLAGGCSCYASGAYHRVKIEHRYITPKQLASALHRAGIEAVNECLG